MQQINASQAIIVFIVLIFGCIELTIADDRFISTQWRREEQAQEGSHFCDAKRNEDSSEEVSCTTEVHFTQKPPADYSSKLKTIESRLKQIESLHSACLTEYERKLRPHKPDVEETPIDLGSGSKDLDVGADFLQEYPPLVVEPKEKATSSLIFLHEMGDSRLAFVSQFTQMSFKDMRYIFPHAPRKPVTIQGGLVMPAWFDILGADSNSPQDNQGIIESSKIVRRLVAKEIKDGIPAEKIIIGGISQGGVVALYTAFGTDVTIGGVIGLSTWLPMNEYFANPATKKYNTDVPVLQCHGIQNEVVHFMWGTISHNIIKSFNPNATFKAYQHLGHTVDSSVMVDVQQFLQDILKDK